MIGDKIDERQDAAAVLIKLSDDSLRKIKDACDLGHTVMIKDIEFSKTKDAIDYAWLRWVCKTELRYRKDKSLQHLDALHNKILED